MFTHVLHGAGDESSASLDTDDAVRVKLVQERVTTLRGNASKIADTPLTPTPGFDDSFSGTLKAGDELYQNPLATTVLSPQNPPAEYAHCVSRSSVFLN